MTQVILRHKEKKPPKNNAKPFRGFSLDDACDAKIDALAAKFGMSRSQLIVEIVEQIYEGEFGKSGAK